MAVEVFGADSDPFIMLKNFEEIREINGMTPVI